MLRTVCIILCLLTLFPACGKKGADFPQAKIGERVPELKLADLQGTEVALSDYSGNVILLEFWATWCPDCREILPHIQRMYEKSHDAEYKVVTVSVDAKPETVSAFMKENGYSFQTLFGGPDIREQFVVLAIPTLYVIDRKGIIRGSFVEYGEKGISDVESLVIQLIGEQ